ncbi:hypothetical protein LV75_003403 [Actinokineospora diospyrosa]|uniref:Uncharacterized protein n=1 Tax=Actinokineospora diospyrosa TaxID=103728 RepID=A0ABT1IEC4_9PSEU|nr:hypothetical protein [Actinokineospora diospyrosa]
MLAALGGCGSDTTFDGGSNVEDAVGRYVAALNAEDATTLHALGRSDDRWYINLQPPRPPSPASPLPTMAPSDNPQ